MWAPSEQCHVLGLGCRAEKCVCYEMMGADGFMSMPFENDAGPALSFQQKEEGGEKEDERKTLEIILWCMEEPPLPSLIKIKFLLEQRRAERNNETANKIQLEICKWKPATLVAVYSSFMDRRYSLVCVCVYMGNGLGAHLIHQNYSCQFPLHPFNCHQRSINWKKESLEVRRARARCQNGKKRNVCVCARPLWANQKCVFFFFRILFSLGRRRTDARVSNWTHLEYQQNTQKNIFFSNLSIDIFFFVFFLSQFSNINASLCYYYYHHHSRECSLLSECVVRRVAIDTPI